METSTRIPVPGTYNFRDVGGLPARDRQRARAACCSAPTDCTGSARRVAPSCANSASASSSTCATRTRRGSCPTTSTGSTSRCCGCRCSRALGRRRAERGITLEALYERIVTQHARSSSRRCARSPSAGDRSVVVHCTAGKDRTGVVVALALLAAGVDREAVHRRTTRATEANLAGEWLEEMVALDRPLRRARQPRAARAHGRQPARGARVGVIETRRARPRLGARVPPRVGARRCATSPRSSGCSSTPTPE